jgi:hypothetical protein
MNLVSVTDSVKNLYVNYKDFNAGKPSKVPVHAIESYMGGGGGRYT